MARIEEYKAEIRRTFALVEPIATEVAAVFYPTLWTINPSTKVRLSTEESGFIVSMPCTSLIALIPLLCRRGV